MVYAPCRHLQHLTDWGACKWRRNGLWWWFGLVSAVWYGYGTVLDKASLIVQGGGALVPMTPCPGLSAR